MADLPRRYEIERDFENAIRNKSFEQRRQLLVLLGNPPSLTNVPPSYWADAERENEDLILPFLLMGFAASAELHQKLTGAEPRGMSITQAGLSWATTQAQILARRLVDVFRNRLGDLSASQEVLTRNVVTDVLSGDVLSSSAETAAVTATTQAITAGGEFGIQSTVGLSNADRWYTERDKKVCPRCAALDRVERSDWGRIAAAAVYGPPLHPHCRCWIEYAIETNDALAAQ